MFSILLLATWLVGALAQTKTTTNLFQGSLISPSATIIGGAITTGIAGSIIEVNSCGTTTYAIICTEASLCLANATYYVTQGPTTILVSYSTSANGTAGTARESCSVDHSTYAICTETVVYDVAGSKTTVSTTAAASGTDLAYATFPITAGAEKIARPTGKCGTATALGGVAVVKVLVLPAAAAVAVVAGALV
ncbi:hypothetical protein LTS14_002569 [Recurvomyces mirabilis]|uniref:uncharacterized protein n=1 Tax=Recurvomyces mirabilis TaxID=574656 RepID=UPI002DDE5936|nr:hypothetical protein LTS14_002569 [Recurvomyces mirabilis]